MGYTLAVRDSMMIAHSFRSAEFGPAQALHGATYTVDVEFRREALVPELNWVVDIGEASRVLSKVMKKYHLKNLDEIFGKQNTTTEFMCKTVYEDVAREFSGRFSGEVKVRLGESHKAWASYTGKLV